MVRLLRILLQVQMKSQTSLRGYHPDEIPSAFAQRGGEVWALLLSLFLSPS